MWFVVKRLSLGLVLIALMSSLLLVSDWSQRKQNAQTIPRVAILQYASDPIIDDGIEGIIEGLAENGFTDRQNIAVRRYNAQGDMANVNAIAREMTNGQFDLVITTTTPCLQAVANANRDGKTMHVFGIVTDPFIAGVGLKREAPLDHPKHLVGIGSFEPVEANIRFANGLFPALKVIGAVWNPAEANSHACMSKARAICRELGIQLLEANVDNSSAVLEAADSLVARGAQALWVGGDNTANIALEAIVLSGRKGRIPVFTTNVGSAERGAFFDLGPDYRQVGRLVGALAAQVLHRVDPATIPIKDIVPEQVMINTLALKGLKDQWQLPADVLERADMVVDERGTHKKTAAALPKPSDGGRRTASQGK
jgi:putative ABC transport system substrate-binding protein